MLRLLLHFPEPLFAKTVELLIWGHRRFRRLRNHQMSIRIFAEGGPSNLKTTHVHLASWVARNCFVLGWTLRFENLEAFVSERVKAALFPFSRRCYRHRRTPILHSLQATITRSHYESQFIGRISYYRNVVSECCVSQLTETPVT